MAQAHRQIRTLKLQLTETLSDQSDRDYRVDIDLESDEYYIIQVAAIIKGLPRRWSDPKLGRVKVCQI